MRIAAGKQSDLSEIGARGYKVRVKALEGRFIIEVSARTVEAEKAKARALKKSQWWRRRIDAGVCHYCRRPVPPAELTMDHIVPIIRGGRSTRGNVVPACKTCNNRKKYLLPVEWEEYLADVQDGTSSER